MLPDEAEQVESAGQSATVAHDLWGNEGMTPLGHLTWADEDEKRMLIGENVLDGRSLIEFYCLTSNSIRLFLGYSSGNCTQPDNRHSSLSPGSTAGWDRSLLAENDRDKEERHQIGKSNIL